MNAILGLAPKKEVKLQDPYEDDKNVSHLRSTHGVWRPPPGFVARDELEKEAKLGGFHIDADVVQYDELLWICVDMWHEQNNENMVTPVWLLTAYRPRSCTH